MLSNKKRNVLLFVTVSVLVAAGIGFYWYNKPTINVLNSNGIPVAATDLYAHFITDSVMAKKKYADKVLDVSGTVTRISENNDHQPVLMLKTGNGDAAINCTLEGVTGTMQAGQNITIRGICGGMGEGDSDLGIMGDVYLLRCHIIN